MKISHIQQIQAVQKYRHNQERPEAGKAKQNQKKDEVQISDQAKQLQQVDGDAEMKSERIAQLKEAVRTGTYHVDAGKIAEKLLPHVMNKQK